MSKDENKRSICIHFLTNPLFLPHTHTHPRRLAAAELINEIIGEGNEIIPLGKFPSLPRRHQVHHDDTAHHGSTEKEDEMNVEAQNDSV